MAASFSTEEYFEDSIDEKSYENSLDVRLVFMGFLFLLKIVLLFRFLLC